MKRNFKGQFVGKAKTIGDIVEASVIGAWNWTEKTLVICAFIGAVFMYKDAKTYFANQAHAQTYTVSYTATTTPSGDRRDEVAALHAKLANDIFNDTKFASTTQAMINEVIKERRDTAAIQALTVMSIQMDTTHSQIMNH